MIQAFLKAMTLIMLFATGLISAVANANDQILIVVTSHGFIGDDEANSEAETGYYLSEVTHPYYVFKNAGYKVDIASPKGGLPPMDPGSYELADDDNRLFMETTDDWQNMEFTQMLADIKADEYVAVLFAGGHGTMWDFPDNPDIQRLIREIYENNGVVGAVCHGPAALINATLSDGQYLVADKQVSPFTNLEERIIRRHRDMPYLLENRLEQRGALLEKSWIPFMEQVSVDERLVTGQNPNSARATAQQMVSLLQNR